MGERDGAIERPKAPSLLSLLSPLSHPSPNSFPISFSLPLYLPTLSHPSPIPPPRHLLPFRLPFRPSHTPSPPHQHPISSTPHLLPTICLPSPLSTLPLQRTLSVHSPSPTTRGTRSAPGSSSSTPGLKSQQYTSQRTQRIASNSTRRLKKPSCFNLMS